MPLAFFCALLLRKLKRPTARHIVITVMTDHPTEETTERLHQPLPKPWRLIKLSSEFIRRVILSPTRRWRQLGIGHNGPELWAASAPNFSIFILEGRKRLRGVGLKGQGIGAIVELRS